MKLNIEVEQSIISEQVVAAFAVIPEVQVIYMASERALLIFWVFSNEPVYDDALMDRLIDQELELNKRYSDTRLDFRFVSLVLCPDPHEIMPGRAVAVYQRLDG